MSFFHVSISNTNCGGNCMDFFHIGFGFFCRTYVRFTHNFHQRHSSTVQINQTFSAAVCMNQFPCILFHVNTSNTNTSFASGFSFNFQPSVFANRSVKLGNLIGFRQIRVEVIFSGKLRIQPNITIQRKSQLCCKFRNLTIQNRQGTWQTQTNRTSV